MIKTQNVEEAIGTGKIQSLAIFPFFGILLLKLPIIKNNKICKTICTDYSKIYYNEDYLKTLSQSEISWALIHEVMHVAYKHSKRRQERDAEIWNYACDYSIHCIMEDYIEAVVKYEREIGRERKLTITSLITRNPSWLYNKDFQNKSSEEIYNILKENSELMNGGEQFDEHIQWESSNLDSDIEQSEYIEADWDIFLAGALEKAKEKLAGTLPLGLERLLNSLIKPMINWRELLHDFLQFEIYDYSFNPPDKRFSFSDCILPDFNEVDESVKNIIWYSDTSSSVSDEDLTKVYSEITGIFDYFDHLEGFLGFFDHEAYKLHSFENVIDLLSIKPVGGGGTSFYVPFEYIKENFKEEIACIIIVTDGYAAYPPQEIANGVPVLWLLTENNSPLPSWGQTAFLN